MKKIYIFIIIIAIIAGGIGIYFYNKNNTSSNNSSQKLPPYNATKVSTNNENSNTNSQKNTTNSNSDTSENQTQENTENTQSSTLTGETEIASFTTKIYTKDSDRQTNISITCSSLNDTTVENGQTFSFCDTVGKASSSKGYKKADVFVDGKKIEALGRSEIAK